MTKMEHIKNKCKAALYRKYQWSKVYDENRDEENADKTLIRYSRDEMHRYEGKCEAYVTVLTLADKFDVNEYSDWEHDAYLTVSRNEKMPEAWRLAEATNH